MANRTALAIWNTPIGYSLSCLFTPPVYPSPAFLLVYGKWVEGKAGNHPHFTTVGSGSLTYAAMACPPFNPLPPCLFSNSPVSQR